MQTKMFYRYECYFGQPIKNIFTKKIEYLDSDFVCSQLPMIKETPKGYWIYEHQPLHDDEMDIFNNEEEFAFGYQPSKKWVSKTGKKRYAYPTKPEALVNFIKRKQSALEHLEQQLAKTKAMIKIALLEQEKQNNGNN